jgi:exodeoxyribonuclease V alpha subunit
MQDKALLESNMSRFIAKIERVVFRNEENGYVVLRVAVGEKRITAVGYLFYNGSLEGVTLSFVGKWQSSKYGREFAFSEATLKDSELFYFLAKVVKGLGETLARELINYYGEEKLLDILENNPEQLTEFKGIKQKKKEKIAESWNKHKNIRELSNLLLPYGVSASLIMRVYNEFSDKSAQIIKENPYKLTNIRGVGFKTADKVARKLQYPPDSPKRIAEGIIYVMSDHANTGHTYIQRDNLKEKAKETLSFDDDLGKYELNDSDFEQGLERPIQDEKITEIRKNTYALTGFYIEEKAIVNTLVEKSKTRVFNPVENIEGFICDEQEKMGIKFSEQQEKAVRTIAEGISVFALSGYAGAGKTTVSKALFDLLAGIWGREQVVACALSGIASDRIKKTTGFSAYTIHTLLKWNGSKFEYNKDNKLPYKVVLLDEASMVNTDIFYKLLSAVSKGAVFIMVGDPAQLPPIGPGNVFSDVLKKGLVPHVSLTKIYRQSNKSVITYFASFIRKGQAPPDYKDYYDDFSFRNVSIPNYYSLKNKLKEEELKELRDKNSEEILTKILKIAEKNKEWIRNPITDFQVISPIKRGVLGTDNLNAELQKILNPLQEQKENKIRFVSRFGMEFRAWDKVVHLKNKNMQCVSYAEYRTSGLNSEFKQVKRIYNGNLGIILNIDEEDENVYVFYYGDGGIVVKYDFDEMGDIVNLAYALTVHKIQGSQAKVVVMPVVSSHYIMLNNKLLYTAVTRAEEKVCIFGQDWIFRRACQNIDEAKRDTVIDLLAEEKKIK